MGDHFPPAIDKAVKPRSYEALLARSLLEIRQNRLDEALRDIEALLRLNPAFKLAHLIRGDLLLARAHPISNLGNVANTHQERVSGLREEARVRLQNYLTQPPTDQVPAYLLQMPPEQRHAIVVDTQKSRLYLFQNQNGSARYVADYYISSGKNGAEKLKEGDQKTPIGVYFVTSSLPRSQLSDFYGSGAFPISYPNEWDKKQGRNGYGIWLHGTPSDTYSRPPRSSNGCVVLTNPDLNALSGMLQIGVTPVIISEDIEWSTENRLRSEREALQQAMESWRRDWESLDTRRYLRHYSRNFSTPGEGNYETWAARKHQVNSGKTSIRVKLSGVSIFRYPGKNDLVTVTFEQDYRSNNLNNRMRKRQYWQQENGEWKIVYEGSA